MAGKYALLIGNREYLDQKFKRLSKPEADVTALAQVLSDRQIGGFDDVKTQIDQSADILRREIGRLFSKKAPEDLILLFFAGHGVRDDRGRLYLATTDTEGDILSATAIPATFITEQMDQSRSRKQVLVLDCCFSGAFADGTRASETESVTSTAFSGSSGRVVLTASDSCEYAWEDGEAIADSPNSVFTRYLVEGLVTGKADLDGDGLITIEEWYTYVYQQVRAATPRQTPHRWIYQAAGDIPIARNPRPRMPLDPTLVEHLKSGYPHIREAAVQELERILEDGHPGLREPALEALRPLAKVRDRRLREEATRIIEIYDSAKGETVPTLSGAAPRAGEHLTAGLSPGPPQLASLEFPLLVPSTAPASPALASRSPDSQVALETPRAPSTVGDHRPPEEAQEDVARPNVFEPVPGAGELTAEPTWRPAEQDSIEYVPSVPAPEPNQPFSGPYQSVEQLAQRRFSFATLAREPLTPAAVGRILSLIVTVVSLYCLELASAPSLSQILVGASIAIQFMSAARKLVVGAGDGKDVTLALLLYGVGIGLLIVGVINGWPSLVKWY